MDRQEHAQHVEHFQKIRPRFETHANIMSSVLWAAAKRYAPLAIVQARAKET